MMSISDSDRDHNFASPNNPTYQIHYIHDSKFAPPDQTAYTAIMVWCPGCKDASMLPVITQDLSSDILASRPFWGFNSDTITLDPSILSLGLVRCHSYIRNGNWEFLSDCDHELAGQTVPLPPLPDWLVR